jgi:hypothetical protein
VQETRSDEDQDEREQSNGDFDAPLLTPERRTAGENKNPLAGFGASERAVRPIAITYGVTLGTHPQHAQVR